MLPHELQVFRNSAVRAASARAYVTLSMRSELLHAANSFSRLARLSIAESYLPAYTFNPGQLALLYRKAHTTLRRWKDIYEDFAKKVEGLGVKEAHENETKRKRSRPVGTGKASLKLKKPLISKTAKVRAFAAVCERKRDKKKREKRC